MKRKAAVHELSIAMNIVEIAEEHARADGANKVTLVALRVGTLSGVDTAALETAFTVAREGTMLAEAELDIERATPRFGCPECSVEFESDDPHGTASCPRCGAPGHLSEVGTELDVRYLEVV